MTVLFIDKDPQRIDSYVKAVTQSGFQASTVSSGVEGIEKAKLEHPDIIVLGQMLPNMSGNDVLRVLKQTPETSKIPVIMFSYFSGENFVKEAMELGAADYFQKDQVAPEDFVKKLQAVITMYLKGGTGWQDEDASLV
ncbi:MAG TPA: response regulator [Patescibacteria group bacterium]|nr:response regulator [Patescibacteria group bacterium]